MKLSFASSPAPRLLAGFGVAALLAAGGLFASSRPARSTGGPIPVTIANTVSTNDADSFARQPYQESADVSTNSYDFGGHNFTAVPAGKRLVIESVTAEGNTYNSQTAFTIELYSHSSRAGLSLVRGSEPYPIKTQPVLLALEAGQSPSVQVESSSPSPYGVNVSVSGYYVDVP